MPAPGGDVGGVVLHPESPRLRLPGGDRLQQPRIDATPPPRRQRREVPRVSGPRRDRDRDAHLADGRLAGGDPAVRDRLARDPGEPRPVGGPAAAAPGPPARRGPSQVRDEPLVVRWAARRAGRGQEVRYWIAPPPGVHAADRITNRFRSDELRIFAGTGHHGAGKKGVGPSEKAVGPISINHGGRPYCHSASSQVVSPSSGASGRQCQMDCVATAWRLAGCHAARRTVAGAAARAGGRRYRGQKSDGWNEAASPRAASGRARREEVTSLP